MSQLKSLEKTVFPSKEQTIKVEHDEKYSGAHKYEFKNCLGFDQEKQQPIYEESYQTIQFLVAIGINYWF